FVGSLPFSIKEEDLKEIFEEYGTVTSAKIITDKYSGRSKGFGFVEMPDDAEAKKCIEELNGAELEGRTIVVNESIPKAEGERKSSFNKGGGGYNKGGSRGGNGGGGFNRSGGGDRREGNRR
ncbi:MAG: RNA-binding protein, partial [Bacteroidota bacterium]